jgi:hypothetical protein
MQARAKVQLSREAGGQLLIEGLSGMGGWPECSLPDCGTKVP